MGLKMSEILLIMAVLMLLFGASRLPQLGSSLGSAIRNFKKGFAGEDDAPATTDEVPVAKGVVQLSGSSATDAKRAAQQKAPSGEG